jgi:hypothetical protein
VNCTQQSHLSSSQLHSLFATARLDHFTFNAERRSSTTVVCRLCITESFDAFINDNLQVHWATTIVQHQEDELTLVGGSQGLGPTFYGDRTSDADAAIEHIYDLSATFILFYFYFFARDDLFYKLLLIERGY